MSRRDELAAVLSEHREDGSYPDTCCCETTVSYDADGHYAGHLADAVLAWLGAQLGDEGLREATTQAIGRSHEAGRAKSELETFGAYDRRRAREDTSAALRQVREWFGVAE